jgi:hypothetical protein
LGLSANNFEENPITISNPVIEKIELTEVILKKYNRIKLYDIYGKKIVELNSLTKNIDVSNLKSGGYIIQFYNGENKSETIKIIKK